MPLPALPFVGSSCSVPADVWEVSSARGSWLHVALAVAGRLVPNPFPAPALPPPLPQAVCLSKKSWQARHTGIKIVQQIAILMGCAVLPHLRAMVDIVKHGLKVGGCMGVVGVGGDDSGTHLGIEKSAGSFSRKVGPGWRHGKAAGACRWMTYSLPCKRPADGS